MAEKKTAAQKLKEKLFLDRQNGYYTMTDEDIKASSEFAELYKDFLDKSKTEREAVSYAVALLKKKGFKEFRKGKKLKAGDKIYKINRGKAVLISVIGSAPIAEGVRLCAAHIDSPRLDMKQNPLYEDNEMALLKTHYYGGIKKYQWTTIPLSLHGVVIKADGTSVTVNIGEDDKDPVFCVSDLLPHLAAEQMSRPASKLIRGEDLNIIVGSRPFSKDKESESVKLNIMNILFEKYGITEADLVSAELEAVPAFKARDIGFDRSLIGGYGHDDRCCSFPALMAAVDSSKPVHTSVTVLTDKEETGSDGNTGLRSSYLRYFIEDIAEALGEQGRDVLSASECLSADVNAAFDPMNANLYDKDNTSMLGGGVTFQKYTGSRGKSGASDANPEFIAKVRAAMYDANVSYQMAELGKVDQGGGGTIAYHAAKYGMDVLDGGVAVLSMHAPWEITSKEDISQMYECCKAFLGLK